MVAKNKRAPTVAMLLAQLHDTIEDVQGLASALKVAHIDEQTTRLSNVQPPNDQCFRAWLKTQVYNARMTITDFINETGLSRHLCSVNSAKYDPSMANFVLSCEIVAIWQGRSFDDVLLEGLHTTKAYKLSVTRFNLDT
tara:strand:- start:75 stop:491 length:417 start_codon:yes stop_codon:yes gene_type:complete